MVAMEVEEFVLLLLLPHCQSHMLLSIYDVINFHIFQTPPPPSFLSKARKVANHSFSIYIRMLIRTTKRISFFRTLASMSPRLAVHELLTYKKIYISFIRCFFCIISIRNPLPLFWLFQ